MIVTAKPVQRELTFDTFADLTLIEVTNITVSGEVAEVEFVADLSDAEQVAVVNRIVTANAQLEQVRLTLLQLANEVSANVAQADADAAAYPTADAQTQAEIIVRVITGTKRLAAALGELGAHLGIQ